jgi:putative NADH-flavin reductase
MKVLVLGASGRLGRVLTARSLSAGCTVTAFTRHPGPLLTGDPSIRIFGGSVHDARAVERVMHGQDAVIWAVAPRPTADRATLPLLHGTRIVIRAMAHAGVPRLIYVSDGALHDTDAGDPGTRLLRSMLGNPAKKEAREREAAIRESPLDWTIVRPARLTAGPHTGAYAVTLEPPARASQISRADAATFIASQLGEYTFLRQIPHLVAKGAHAASSHGRPGTHDRSELTPGR